ncbi:hypothetical protein [Saccharothrix sp. Mg75]|uniref:hypothetical protein n=1 Tax=Saccharothrix sp. Mg75 TaxID=3445357 RepID=UPI003EE8F002
MPGTARRRQAACGRLARLVVVLAVFAGFAIGLQCTDGMAPAMPMAHGVTSASCACGSPAADMVLGTCVSLATVMEEGSPKSDGLGGALAVCLAFLVAVVAAAASLGPDRLRGVFRLLRPAPAVVVRAVRPRALSLAELCLLRT